MFGRRRSRHPAAALGLWPMACRVRVVLTRNFRGCHRPPPPALGIAPPRARSRVSAPVDTVLSTRMRGGIFAQAHDRPLPKFAARNLSPTPAERLVALR